MGLLTELLWRATEGGKRDGNVDARSIYGISIRNYFGE